jgi:hypothetical protein
MTEVLFKAKEIDVFLTVERDQYDNRLGWKYRVTYLMDIGGAEVVVDAHPASLAILKTLPGINDETQIMCYVTKNMISRHQMTVSINSHHLLA